MHNTVTLVRKKAEPDSNGQIWCCENCILNTLELCDEIGDIKRITDTDDLLYCGDEYYWQLKLDAEEQKGE